MAMLQVIEWIDQGAQELVRRVPERGSGEIRLGSQLVVREKPGRRLFPRRALARHLWRGAAHPQHAEPAAARPPLQVALRREPLQVRGVLRQPQDLYRHEVGHAPARHPARRRPGHGAAARVRRLQHAGAGPRALREHDRRHALPLRDAPDRSLPPLDHRVAPHRPDRLHGHRLPGPAAAASTRSALRPR